MAHNTYGGGSYRKLPSGNWHVQLFDGYRDDGKRNIICMTAKTKRELQEKVTDYWEHWSTRVLRPSSRMPFSKWADCWYRGYRTQVQPSTYAGYGYTLEHLKSYFGERPLCDIRPLDVVQFHNDLAAAGRSRSYILKDRMLLIEIFDAAVTNELMPGNPARKAKMPRVIPTLETISEFQSGKDAFSEAEIQLLREHLPENMVGQTILLMISTGLSPQEMLALQPSDIAPDGSSLSVSKAIQTVHGVPVLGPPKNLRSVRTVPIPQNCRKYALYLREHSGKPYVWTSTRENGLFSVDSFRRLYYKALAEVPGVRPLSPHCCRHTYVSTLERLGVPMEQIARLAGHSKIQTTNIYLHTTFETLAEAVSVLNQNA